MAFRAGDGLAGLVVAQTPVTVVEQDLERVEVTEAARDTRRAGPGHVVQSPPLAFRGPAMGPLAFGPGMAVSPCRRHDLEVVSPGPGGAVGDADECLCVSSGNRESPVAVTFGGR